MAYLIFGLDIRNGSIIVGRGIQKLKFNTSQVHEQVSIGIWETISEIYALILFRKTPFLCQSKFKAQRMKVLVYTILTRLLNICILLKFNIETTFRVPILFLPIHFCEYIHALLIKMFDVSFPKVKDVKLDCPSHRFLCSFLPSAFHFIVKPERTSPRIGINFHQKIVFIFAHRIGRVKVC